MGKMKRNHSVEKLESLKRAKPLFRTRTEMKRKSIGQSRRLIGASKKDTILAFYDYPANNWQQFTTHNPIEFVFATVRLRTPKTKKKLWKPNDNADYGVLTDRTGPEKMVPIRVYIHLTDVITDVKFVDGIKLTGDHKRVTVRSSLSYYK